MTDLVNSSEKSEQLATAALPELITVIDGEFVDGEGEQFTVTSPVNGAVLGTPRATSPAQVAAAAGAARAAQTAWAGTPADDRSRMLMRLAMALIGDLDRLAHLITLDNGKTYGEAVLDVYAAAGLLESAAGWATRVKGTTMVEGSGLERLTWRDPVGVVGIFMPFNAPLMFSALKAGAAIAAGNTVVVKSPDQNPYAAAAFVEHAAAVGIPAGVINLVQGGAEVGRALVEADEIDMLSFTGSSRVGVMVGEEAVRRHKRLILELGGKSANVVYDDADLDQAVTGSLGAIFRNSGQRCFSGSRLLLQEGIYEEFLGRYIAEASELRVGDPFDPATQVGTLISHRDVERVHAVVEQARAEGATILCGGELVTTPGGGAHYPPTVIDCTDVPDASVLKDEVFGPVVAVQMFSTEEEAVELANSTEYALAGGCWTGDIGRALRTARAVDAGMFWINSYAVHGGVETTIGGRRASGFGQEMGEEGFLAYTNVKSVLIDAHGTSAKEM